MSEVKELATTRKSVERQTGLVVVGGHVTQTACARLMHANGDWLQRNAVLAQVVSYEEAVTAMRPDVMFGHAMSATLAHPKFITPTAFLVRGDQLSLFDEYARLMRQGGLLQRAVFTDADDARRWAARQAQVQAHWLACRHRASASPVQPNTEPRAPQARPLSL